VSTVGRTKRNASFHTPKDWANYSPVSHDGNGDIRMWCAGMRNEQSGNGIDSCKKIVRTALTQWNLAIRAGLDQLAQADHWEKKMFSRIY
jgi:hypothetical protein